VLPTGERTVQPVRCSTRSRHATSGTRRGAALPTPARSLAPPTAPRWSMFTWAACGATRVTVRGPR
jgi:hypothetical protein